MKTCTKCGKTKPLNDFYKKADSKDGHASHCKICGKEKARQWREKNPERFKQNLKAWYEKNKEYAHQKMTEWRAANKDKWNEYGKNYRDKNDEKEKERGKRYRDKNKIKTSIREKKYRYENKEKRAASIRHYQAAKLNRTPKWLSQDQIAEIRSFYEAAIAFKIYAGNDYHVDHIVPLRGKTVSGLHVPWNLQVLPEFENVSKGNRTWPDAW